MTLNDHPHSGIAHHEEVYEELAKALGHDTTKKNPVQFDPTSPKFMQAFFNIVHRRLEDQGCDFWWIDWQQGSHSRIPGFDPLWLLNHFQYLNTKQTTKSSEPIIFSRYAGPGSHRYPVGFSGDTYATWASLEFQPEFTATASNIGFGWWSNDIGGHMPGYRDDECTVRWIQYGVFSPILRLHSTNSRWMSKEPWLYRNECMLVMKHAMQLRHRLVPYIFSVNMAAILPLVQPLYWNFPDRAEAYRYPNQYYFGPSLVVAPIVIPRNKITNLAKTQVWIPPRRHVDVFTGTVYTGDREIEMYRPLECIPVLAPEGSIIPLENDEPGIGCSNPDSFDVIVIVGHDGQFEIIEDQRDDVRGKSEGQRVIPIKYDQKKGQLTFVTAKKSWIFRFISANLDPSHVQVSFDGSVSKKAKCSAEYSSGVQCTVVQLPTHLEQSKKATIELGASPSLTILDHSTKLIEMLYDFQIEFETKDRIWEIVQTTQSPAVKVGRILSLGLEETIYGPVLELLLADSRLVEHNT